MVGTGALSPQPIRCKVQAYFNPSSYQAFMADRGQILQDINILILTLIKGQPSEKCFRLCLVPIFYIIKWLI
jgi:hypothetical protein